jgi:hypothetical protein
MASSPRMARSTDASRLSVPLQFVIAIVISALSAASAVWTVQSRNDVQFEKLSSDVRDISTRMDAAKQVDAEKSKVSDERAAALREAVQEMKRRQELQQYEIQQLKEAILKLSPQERR